MSYADRLGAPDFRVRYKWLPASEDGFFQRPFQHIRCDFSYVGDDIKKTGIYRIWPDFEGPDERPIPEGEEIPESGTTTCGSSIEKNTRTSIGSGRGLPYPTSGDSTTGSSRDLV